MLFYNKSLLKKKKKKEKKISIRWRFIFKRNKSIYHKKQLSQVQFHNIFSERCWRQNAEASKNYTCCYAFKILGNREPTIQLYITKTYF